MAWDEFFDLFAMGGYAAFVWPAFIVSAIVLIGLLVISLRFLKTQRELLQELDPSESDRNREA